MDTNVEQRRITWGPIGRGARHGAAALTRIAATGLVLHGVAAAQLEILWQQSPPPGLGALGGLFLSVADANADGWSDVLNVLTAAYGYGQVLVLISGADGTVLESDPISDGLVPSAMVWVDDVTGDGYPDILLGHDAPADPAYPGAIVLRDGRTLLTMLGLSGSASNVSFGAALCVGPDLTGDGVREVFVADPKVPNSLGKLGVVQTFDVAAWTMLAAPVFENPPSPYTLTDNSYAADMLYLGDIDADGSGELAIGDPGFGVFLDGRIEIRDVASGLIQAESFSSVYWGALGASLNRYRDVDGDGIPEIAAWQKLGLVSTANRFVLISPISGAQIGTIEPIDAATHFGGELLEIGDIDADATPDYISSFVSSSISCAFLGATTPLVWVSGAHDAVVYQHKSLCGADFGYGYAGAVVSDPAGAAQKAVVLGKSEACGQLPWCPSWIAAKLAIPGAYEPQGAVGGCHGLHQTWSGWVPSFQGHQTDLKLDGATPLQLNFLLLSLDASQWAGVPLPLDLSSFGATGCNLLVPPDVLVAELADANGHAEAAIVLSTDEPVLYGLSAYAQWVGYTPQNPLSLATSNALELVLLP